MTDKITLTTFASLQNDVSATADLNANSAKITSAINNTLSRDGTAPNQMGAALDMNSNHIINLPAPASNFDAVRLLDVTSLGGGGTITVNPLPVGGTTGQVLSKNSNTNFDAGWTAVVTGVNVSAGKTLTVTNSLALSGTDGTSFSFPSGSDTVAGLNATQALSNKTINTASGNVISINGTVLNGVTGSGAVVLASGPVVAGPTFTGSFTATNLVTNASLSQMAAVTLKGNPTNATANATDFTINSLTTLGSPDAVNDFLLIWDHTAGTLKKANPTAISGAAVAGVSSIAGNTGNFTLGTGLTNSSNILLADATYHRGYLAGCTLSGGGSQVLTVNAGIANSDDFSTLMSLPSNYTKAIQTAWAVGSGNGSLDTGAIASSTWYHVYIIERLDTNVVDVLTSTNASTPTMPANYTVKRRIGSFKTDGSSNIIGFNQRGDEFLWNTPTLDVSVNTQGSSAILRTLNVPAGVRVNALINGSTGGNFTGSLLITSPDQTDVATDFSGSLPFTAGFNSTSNFPSIGGSYRTNTSQQIRTRGSTTTIQLYITTQGWVDTRGRFL